MVRVSMASEAILSSERDAIDNRMSDAHQTLDAGQFVSNEILSNTPLAQLARPPFDVSTRTGVLSMPKTEDESMLS